MFDSIIRFHKIPLFVTVISWLLVGYYLGPSAFFLVIVLTILEVTLSADNAVVNSRVLVKMSPLWQKLFMTVGIFIAVFLIRFALPIVLVAIASGGSVKEVLDLALNDADEYGKKLHEVAPYIDGFGGMFLFMVATFFFVDINRQHFWIRDIERRLAHIGSVPFFKTIALALLFITIVLALPAELKIPVGISMMAAIIIYSSLHAVTFLMERIQRKNINKKQVGWAAFGSFMYLEVLDASFSLDGVVGAFAITNNIIIIMIGLGVGALWVRSLTLHMVEKRTLNEYKYLESGAHWAIAFLSIVMFLKLFHIEMPEVVVGSVGLLAIAASIYSSKRHRKKHEL
jgi:hypothetical protein